MFLTWRPMEPGDFGVCRSLLMDHCAYDAQTYARILDLWASLMETGQFETGIVEDHERPPDRRVVGFVTYVFGAEWFVAELLSEDFPAYVNCQITRRWMQGKSPLLTTEQVRKANSGNGVNMILFHFGIAMEGVSAADLTFLRDKLHQVCLEIGLGYQTRRIFVEVYDPVLLRYNQNAGMHLVRRKAPDTSREDSKAGPYLMVATREEALEGTLLGPYFLHQEPRLHFKDGEQHLLRRALLGESDEETATALAVSVSTVHKRWMAIYDRAARVFPYLFPDAGSVPGTDAVKRRGLEKRRHLLAYVQSHREELRPYPHPVTPRRGKDDRRHALSSTARETQAHVTGPAAKSA